MQILITLRKMNRGLLELTTGILFLGVICLIVGSLFVKEPLPYAVALTVGVLLALITAYHMYRTLDKALSPGVDASKAVTTASLVRYVCILVVLGVILMTDKLNPLITFMGLMTLKVAAYIQPLTHKVCNKIFHEVDPIPQPMQEPADGGVVDNKEESIF